LTRRPTPAKGRQAAPALSIESIDEQLRVLIDPTWYAAKYPDVRRAGLEPVHHYIHFGANEGRDPNPFFDGAWYLAQYPDVAVSGMPALLHYLRDGASELRNPHPRFDATFYVEQHPEAAPNPLLYHLMFGRARGWITEQPVAVADYLPSKAAALKTPAKVVVDIVVPVYRGLAQTQRCLDSVLADDARMPGHIIVIDDRSPETKLSAWLQKLAAAGKIRLIRNQKNLGFVGSVNKGMKEAGRNDVILLNSDTEVPRGWTRRLAAQAYAAPRIASVSPFSNRATICSYPSNRGADLPPGLTLAELDEETQAANAGRSVALPTTVGFAMYIRRAALDEVGPFDADAFGRGYGEENDFCMRASARGWTHRLACDVFVYHEGEVSFGADAPELAQAWKVLGKRYPTYARQVALHVQLDAVGPARMALTLALFRRSALPCILMVSHQLGGGVKRHIDALAARLAGTANVLLLEATPRGVSVSVPAIPDHAVMTVASDRMDALADFLAAVPVTRAHVHHVMGIDLDLRGLLHRLGLPFDVTLHDYYGICPQVNLLPALDGQHCQEPGAAVCNACIAQRSSHGARDILSWRRLQAWLFLEAERVVCPSADARDRLLRHVPAARAVLAPHEPVPDGPWPQPAAPPLRRGVRLKVAVIGVLAAQKGANAVITLAEAADPADIALHVIGYPEDELPRATAKRLRTTGKYREADLPGLLDRIRPHVVWFPAQWPETYSYTLSAAIAAGLPIVATRIGAFPERLEGRPLTWLCPPNAATADWLATFEAVRDALQAPAPPLPAPRPAAADFYAEAYPSVLRARPSVARPIDLRRPGRLSVVVVPETYDNGAPTPCAYIRLLQPLDHPAIGADIDIVLADATEALDYRADVIATQRYAVPDADAAARLAAHCRQHGIILLYDLDDDLLHIPPEHPEYAELRLKVGLVRALVAAADAVWVSTEALRASVARAGRAATVIANALDERIWMGLAPPPQRPPVGPLRIVYMGTATHDADFATVEPALARLIRGGHGRIGFDVVGVSARSGLPGWVNRVSPTIHALSSYPGFVNWVTQQRGWDIGIAPLVDTPFNRCKSAIKTLDYAALGLPVLASDIAVFRGSLADGPGGMLVENTPNAWYAALSLLAGDPRRRQALAEGARAAFLAKHTLAVQAEARRAAWHALAGRAPQDNSAPLQRAARGR
jgi:GT2 family glycosyltransferase/glycosyltransferase involved in cell wall biosynthesis